MPLMSIPPSYSFLLISEQQYELRVYSHNFHIVLKLEFVILSPLLFTIAFLPLTAPRFRPPFLTIKNGIVHPITVHEGPEGK
jgi:hypothetical protein